MKICFLTDDPQELGGGPEHIRELAKLLRTKYHHDVDIITPKVMDPNFSLSDFWSRIKFAFWTVKIILLSDYYVYHSHSFSTSFFLPIVRLRGRVAGITVHGLGKNLLGGGIVNLTGIPQFLSWLILEIWPYNFRLSAGNLPGFITVGNGVNISEFAKFPASPDRKYFTVLCVSRRDPVKGVEILERAIKIIQKKYPNTRLNLVTGRRRTVKDFKTADLYVLPSLSEGLPVVLLEAMAAELPIIATDVGDCKKILTEAKAGLIIPPNDVNRLVYAIIEMQNNKKQHLFGLNGRNFVKTHYTWEKVADGVNNVYKHFQTRSNLI